VSVQVSRELWIQWTSSSSVCSLPAKNCRAQPSLAEATPTPFCNRKETLHLALTGWQVWQWLAQTSAHDLSSKHSKTSSGDDFDGITEAGVGPR